MLKQNYNGWKRIFSIVLLVSIIFLVGCSFLAESNLITGAVIGIDDYGTQSYGIQSGAPPDIDSISINSTNPGNNNTNQNLTAHVTTSDVDADPVKVIYNWYLNDSSPTLINLAFEPTTNKLNGTDYSGNDHNISAINSGPVYLPSGGYSGGAYNFSTVNNELQLNVTDFPTIGTNDYTLEAWVKSNSSETYQCLFAINSYDPEYCITTGDSILLYDGAEIKSNDGLTIMDNQWHHVAYVRESTGTNGLQYYLDGVHVGNNTHADSLLAVTILRVGYSGFSNEDFRGTIDDLRFWNISLTSDQIAAHADNRTDIIVSQETSIDDEWNFSATPNDGSQDGVADISDNIIVLEVDTTNPSVVDFVPAINLEVNAGASFELAANVTDNVAINNVFANISFPNGTIEEVILNIESGTRYNASYDAPGLIGDYNITFIANDTTNNLNETETSNFSVNDVVNPSIGTLVPALNSIYNISDVIEINATITDDVAVSSAFVNITYPNGTIDNIELSLDGSNVYNTTFTVPSLLGLYNLTFFANDSSGNENRSEVSNFTINDEISPSVFNLTPVVNSVYNVSNLIELSVNVTDIFGVADVIANITFSNGTLQQLTLSNASTHDSKFNNSFTIPLLTGLYNVTYFANDSSGNENRSETSNFTVNDAVNPSVGTLVPALNSVFNVSNVVEINATITDDVNVNFSAVNITYPNGTLEQYGLNLDGSNVYNITFTIPGLIGLYNLTFIANDSSNNLNETEVSNFTVNDVNSLNVSIISCQPDPGNLTNIVECNSSVTDDVAIDTVNVSVIYPNGTVENPTVENTGSNYNFTVTRTDVIGQFNVTWQANDTSNNVQTNTTNFTINDVVSPLVFNLTPAVNSVYNVSNVIELAVNVTDAISVGDVIANVTFSNGTLQQLTLSNASTHDSKFNNSFTIPLLTGLYNITYFANDSSGNENRSETSNFTVNDVVNPSVGTLVPTLNDVYNISNIIELNATITDDVGVNSTFVNVTYPNGTNDNLELFLDGSGVYNTTFTAPALIGLYNLTFFANDSFGNENRSEVSNFTVNDATAPNVGTLVPTVNSVYNVTNVIEINATVTDDVAVSRVFANITLPNGTITQLELGLNVSGIYNNSYAIPATIGDYNITFFANDSSNNENRTESTNFTVNDIINPSVFNLTPAVNSVYNVSNVIELAINVTDDVAISNVVANITFSNGTLQQVTLSNASIHEHKFNNSFTVPGLIGLYNITFFANDTFGNENRTDTSNFTINDVVPPSLNVYVPANASNFTTGDTITIAVNITDDVAISKSFVNISYPNGTLEQYELELDSSNRYNITFTLPLSINGDYNLTYIFNDTTNNVNNAEQTMFSVNMSDIDGDGLDDLSENLVGNESHVTTSGVTALNITVAGNTTNGTFTEPQVVTFYDGNVTIMNFTHNFSTSQLNLSNMSITVTSTSIVVNLSNQLLSGENKTLYLADGGFTALCAKNAEISSASQISSGCTGNNETNLDSCLGNNSGYSSDGLVCYDNGSTIYVENLSFSGIEGTLPSSSSSSSGGGGGGGGSSTGGGSLPIEYGCIKQNGCSTDKYCVNYKCVKLFNLDLLQIDSQLAPGDELDFAYLITSLSEVSGDVTIKYWLEKDGEIITSKIDDINVPSFGKKTGVGNLLLPTGLSYGAYTFNIELDYPDYVISKKQSVAIKKDVPLLLGFVIPELKDTMIGQVWNYEAVLSIGKDSPVTATVERSVKKGDLVLWTKKEDLTLNRSLIIKDYVEDLPEGKYVLELKATVDGITISKEESFEVKKPFKKALAGLAIGDGEGITGNFTIILLILGLLGIIVVFLVVSSKKGERKSRQIESKEPLFREQILDTHRKLNQDKMLYRRGIEVMKMKESYHLDDATLKQLEEYILNEISSGMSKEQISSDLVNGGWIMDSFENYLNTFF